MARNGRWRRVRLTGALIGLALAGSGEPAAWPRARAGADIPLPGPSADDRGQAARRLLRPRPTSTPGRAPTPTPAADVPAVVPLAPAAPPLEGPRTAAATPTEPTTDLPPLAVELDAPLPDAEGPALSGPADSSPPHAPETPPGVLHMEVIPDEVGALDPGLRPLPDAPPSRATRPRVPDDEPMDRDDDPPQRRRRLLGLLGPRPESRNRALRVPPEPGAARDSDPAAEAALRRRLEREIRNAAGRHLRSVDVVVIDRKVIIRAHVDRLWNRRGVRRTIENLPALAGYDARVEVD
jgi:hypothetical protein